MMVIVWWWLFKSHINEITPFLLLAGVLIGIGLALLVDRIQDRIDSKKVD